MALRLIVFGVGLPSHFCRSEKFYVPAALADLPGFQLLPRSEHLTFACGRLPDCRTGRRHKKNRAHVSQIEHLLMVGCANSNFTLAGYYATPASHVKVRPSWAYLMRLRMAAAILFLSFLLGVTPATRWIRTEFLWCSIALITVM
jgi:hypothetical protein